MIPRRMAVCEPKPLRIEGTTTTMTPEPDDAEMAAMALLESLANPPRHPSPKERESPTPNPSPKERGTMYFHALAERVREGRAAETRMARRFVVYAEEQLRNNGKTRLGYNDIEAGLFKHQAAVDREGGELKRRWQWCLAEVMVMTLNILGEAKRQSRAEH